jgi:hypothetical protein
MPTWKVCYMGYREKMLGKPNDFNCCVHTWKAGIPEGDTEKTHDSIGAY